MKTEINKNKFLSGEELSELMVSLRLSTPRNRLMISLLLNLGMRGAELLEAKVGDVNLKENKIHIVGKKNSRSRYFPIPAAVREELEIWVFGKSAQDKLFPVTISCLKTVWMKMRPSEKGLHSLRHTFAIELFRKTRDIKLVQTCLGHRSIQNTMVYADYVYSTEEISDALAMGLFGGVKYG